MPRLVARKADAMAQVAAGNMRVVAAAEVKVRPTLGWVESFTVKEPKLIDRQLRYRRRDIEWPAATNKALHDAGYRYSALAEQCSVDVSNALGGVFAQSATTRDMTAGFYQVPLSQSQSQFLRLLDDEGTIYEMLRLPMGHCVAPEILTLIAATIAGHPSVARDAIPYPVAIDIIVDNIRYTGPLDEVRKAGEYCDARANFVSMSFNAEDTVDAATEYSFGGVQYDHVAQMTSLATKTHFKVVNERDMFASFEAFERTTSRLMFCAAVLNIHLVDYYEALHGARKVFSAFNAGVIGLHDPVHLHPIARAQWQKLVGLARRNEPTRPERAHTGLPNYAVFTDASSTGYGVIICDMDHNTVHAFGARWDAEEESLTISALEMRAVAKALQQHAFRPQSFVVMVIDNRAALAAIAHHRARSQAVNSEFLQVHEIAKALDLSYTVRYIASASNPADALSRGTPLSETLLNEAMGFLG